MHNKEQHLKQKFYDNIGSEVVNFNQVLLFGPTGGNNELLNILKENSRFANTVIEVQTFDKLSEKQQIAFINNYYFEIK